MFHHFSIALGGGDEKTQLVIEIVGLFVILLMALLLQDCCKRIRNAEERAENAEIARIAEAKAHQDLLESIQKKEAPQTAKEILENQPKRIKLRKSWVDIEQDLEDRHNQKAKSHANVVNQIQKALGTDPSLSRKEK